jgi:MtN3 and saliva related transmembrane protein
LLIGLIIIGLLVMDITQITGIAAGVLTSIAMLPQLIKILKEKKAENVSVVMLLVLIAGLALWAVYGFMRSDLPIIITNCFSVLLNSIVLTLRIKYSGVKENAQ